MGTKLANLESVTSDQIQTLEASGIFHTDDVLAHAAGKAARTALAARTGIGEGTLAQLAATADLMRIAGIAEPHTLLLAALDTPTAKVLATRDAAVLIKQMRRKNVELMLARAMPPESNVARWIADAGKLPPGAEL